MFKSINKITRQSVQTLGVVLQGTSAIVSSTVTNIVPTIDNVGGLMVSGSSMALQTVQSMEAINTLELKAEFTQKKVVLEARTKAQAKVLKDEIFIAKLQAQEEALILADLLDDDSYSFSPQTRANPFA